MGYVFPKMRDDVIRVTYGYECYDNITQDDVVSIIQEQLDNIDFDTVEEAINELFLYGELELPNGCMNMESTIKGGLREGD